MVEVSAQRVSTETIGAPFRDSRTTKRQQLESLRCCHFLMELLPGLPNANAGSSKRGRPPKGLSSNFYRLNEKCNQAMWWTVCKYCYAAHAKDPARIPEPSVFAGERNLTRNTCQTAYTILT